MRLDRTTLTFAGIAVLLFAGAAVLLESASLHRTATAADTPAPAPQPAVSIDTAIVQRDGPTLRLLNATITTPGAKDPLHLDLSLTLALDPDGKLRVDTLETRPTTLLGVDALVPGIYYAAKEPYELKGPAFDADHRATWSIIGKGLSGTVIAGPVKGHPQLVPYKAAIDLLPDAGIYGFVSHDRAFPGIVGSTNTLINLRQVTDTLVVTGYALEGSKFLQTGVIVLNHNKPE